jgi:phosphoenolpyruvate synthase/pyruvate phosphate dikinase
VVVQEIVSADCAGVLFTANPLNGQHDETVVTGNWGLGESVVADLVTPDTWIVRVSRPTDDADDDDGTGCEVLRLETTVLSESIACKTKMIVLNESVKVQGKCSRVELFIYTLRRKSY